jgi:hypothetical protein
MRSYLHFFLCVFIIGANAFAQNNIPLPEHPRPDWQRANWLNLNGDWSFQFDKDDVGLKKAGSKAHRNFL